MVERDYLKILENIIEIEQEIIVLDDESLNFLENLENSIDKEYKRVFKILERREREVDNKCTK